MPGPWPLSQPSLVHGACVATGLLIYMLLTRMRNQRRPPSTAVAWVLAITLLPYAAVPLFLLFGTRKVARPAQAARVEAAPSSAPEWAARLLAGLGLAGAAPNRAVAFYGDGEASYRALLALCAGARQRLDLGTYLLGSDSVGAAMADALVAAAGRGVQVRLLIDSVGSLRTSRRLLGRLRAGGVEVRRFMPLLRNPMRGRTNLRNHRKLAIADGAQLWAGGRNLADEYFIDRPRHPAWLDLSFVVDGPLAGQALAQYTLDWRAASGRPPAQAHAGATNPAAAPASAAGPLAQWVPSGPDLAQDTVHDLLMTGAYAARERIVAVTPYFVPDDALLDAWCTACRRGVMVTLVLPRRSNHRLADWARERALRQLADAGAQVFLADAMVHAKAVVIDAEFALCGTVNLDGRSLFLNYEAMAAFYGHSEVSWLAEWMVALAGRSSRYRARRPAWGRDLVEGIVRAIAFQL